MVVEPHTHQLIKAKMELSTARRERVDQLKQTMSKCLNIDLFTHITHGPLIDEFRCL